jgi:hypothetical protein
MDRRQFLESIAGISALIPALALVPALEQQAIAAELHARARAVTGLRTLSPDLDATLSSIADILLPQTDTVGATQIGVSRFIDVLLTEAMLERDRDRFLEGLKAVEAQFAQTQTMAFAAAPREQQEALVSALDGQLPQRAPTRAEAAALAQGPMTAPHGYAVVKQLVLFAYFTSEPVALGIINAPIIPGRYDGCVNT